MVRIRRFAGPDRTDSAGLVLMPGRGATQTIEVGQIGTNVHVSIDFRGQLGPIGTVLHLCRPIPSILDGPRGGVDRLNAIRHSAGGLRSMTFW